MLIIFFFKTNVHQYIIFLQMFKNIWIVIPDLKCCKSLSISYFYNIFHSKTCKYNLCILLLFYPCFSHIEFLSKNIAHFLSFLLETVGYPGIDSKPFAHKRNSCHSADSGVYKLHSNHPKNSCVSHYLCIYSKITFLLMILIYKLTIFEAINDLFDSCTNSVSSYLSNSSHLFKADPVLQIWTKTDML